ncbi:MAG: TolC family protein [Campylobacterota bacterium]|nr:TolC family protein [Campylobacterota bacterium]
MSEATVYSIRHNPSIMVSNYNIKASQYLKEQRSKDFYPKVDLMIQQSLDNNTFGIEEEKNRFRAGLVLTYNLYRGGADSDTKAKAISAIYRDTQTRNELKRQTIEGLELSWSAYIMLERQLKELAKYRDFSEETLNLYKEEYDIGRRTLLDLLSAQNDFINAKSQIIRVKYDGLFAKYRILDSMGLLVAGIMGNEYDYMQKVGLSGVDAVDNIDTLPISYDEDNDNISSLEDECPASLTGADILSNGCTNLSDRFSQVKHFEILNFDRDVELISSKKTLDSIINTLIVNSEKLEKYNVPRKTNHLIQYSYSR